MNTAEFTGVPNGLPGDSSKTYTTPYPIRPGTRCRDLDGNEFIFCIANATVYPGTVAVFDELFNAGPLLIGSRGRVGIFMAGGLVNAGLWVQIYGLNAHVQTSMATDAVGPFGTGVTSGQLCAQTSVTTPSGTISWVSDSSAAGNRIFGMQLTTRTPVQLAISGASDSSFPTSYVTGITDDSGSLGFIAHTGQEVAAFLNYPWVTGIVDQFMS